MFSECTSLIQAPKLPATILAEGCYNQIFSECTSLTQAPKLPATTLAEGCYKWMFSGCTSLTQAPALPATTLEEGCYEKMFNKCTKLSRIKIAFTEWGTGTDYWLEDVAENGTFICPKKLPKKYGDDSIPEGWKIVNEDTSK